MFYALQSLSLKLSDFFPMLMELRRVDVRANFAN